MIQQDYDSSEHCRPLLTGGPVELALRGQDTCGISFSITDEDDQLPKRKVRIKEQVLEPKLERHVSLVAGHTGKLLRSAFNLHHDLEDTVRQYARSWKTSYRRTGHLFLARHVDSQLVDGHTARRFRQTIIERVVVPDAENFYSGLGALLPDDTSIHLIAPPHHVTLFAFHFPRESNPKKLGISITNELEWQERVVRRVYLSELEEVAE